MALVRIVSVIALLAGASFVADQWTKALILDRLGGDPALVPVTPFLNFRLSFNPGVSFGMLQDTLGPYPAAVALGMLGLGVGLIVWATLVRSTLERTGLAIMAGGALGNALDRWRRGAVTDFIDLHVGGLHWPTFNVADIAVVGGCALLIADGVIRPRQYAAETAGR